MKRIIVFLLILIALVSALGVLFYACEIKELSEAKPVESADLLVVLSGGKGRIAQGLELLEHGVAPVLFVTGVEATALRLQRANPKYDLSELQRLKKLVIDQTAKSTKDNALRTKEFIESLKNKPN